jgi:hypothetical protein
MLQTVDHLVRSHSANSAQHTTYYYKLHDFNALLIPAYALITIIHYLVRHALVTYR